MRILFQVALILLSLFPTEVCAETQDAVANGPYIGLIGFATTFTSVSGPQQEILGANGSAPVSTWDEIIPVSPKNFVGEFSSKAVSLGGFTGFNFVKSSMLFGIEGQFSAGLNGYEDRGELTSKKVALPFGNSHGACTPCTALPTEITKTGENFLLFASQTDSYRFENKYDGNLSFRVGYQIGKLVFFGRVGGGVESFSETWNTNNVNSSWCVNGIHKQVWQQHGATATWTANIFRCSAIASGLSTSVQDSSAAPAFLVGLGADYFFRSLFVRAELDLDHAFLSDMKYSKESQGISAVRVGLGVGVKL